MLSKKYGITLEAIDLELDLIHKGFLANRRVLNEQLRRLSDEKAGQSFLVKPAPLAEGTTIATTEAALKSLNDLNNARNRHLNALRRVIEDEMEALADDNQPKLPLQEGQSA